MFANVAAPISGAGPRSARRLEIIFQIFGRRARPEGHYRCRPGAGVSFPGPCTRSSISGLIPTYIAYYTIFPRAIGGRSTATPWRGFSFILFVVVAMPDRRASPVLPIRRSGAAFKFMHSCHRPRRIADAADGVHESAPRRRSQAACAVGAARLGWVTALPWQNPIMLATALSLVMLGFGGAGGVDQHEAISSMPAFTTRNGSPAIST